MADEFKVRTDDALGAHVRSTARRRGTPLVRIWCDAMMRYLADDDRERMEALEDLTQQQGRRISRLEAEVARLKARVAD